MCFETFVDICSNLQSKKVMLVTNKNYLFSVTFTFILHSVYVTETYVGFLAFVKYSFFYLAMQESGGLVVSLKVRGNFIG